MLTTKHIVRGIRCALRTEPRTLAKGAKAKNMKLRLALLPLIVCAALASPAPADVDYRAEMKSFVAAIAAHARTGNPDFGVFPQNASDLGEDAAYVDVCTGIGQEDIHYGYTGDAKPTPPEDVAQLETNLDRFTARGKLVLTLDYPFKQKNKPPKFDRKTLQRVDAAYAASHARGYVATVAVRELNVLTFAPGHLPSPNESPMEWSDVAERAVQLQPARKQSRADYLGALGASGYDLVLLDYSFDGGADAEYTPEEIAALKTQLNGKVVAYLSIGEAEDYRWYWQPTWKPGAPAWLGRENPDWKGNYKVHYWDPAWQAIVMQYLDKIIAQGFDGVYLDLVDAYEYYEE